MRRVLVLVALAFCLSLTPVLAGVVTDYGPAEDWLQDNQATESGVYIRPVLNNTKLVAYSYSDRFPSGLTCNLYNSSLGLLTSFTAVGTLCSFPSSYTLDNSSTYIITIQYPLNWNIYAILPGFPQVDTQIVWVGGYSNNVVGNFYYAISSVTTVVGDAYFCLAGDSDEAFRFYLKDEDVPSSPLNASWEYEATLNNSIMFSGNYSYRENISICSSGDISFDVLNVQYDMLTGPTENYYVLNGDFVGDVLDYTVYGLNTTTATYPFILTVRDKYSNSYKPDIFVSLQRKYLSEGIYRTVQMARSDNFGSASFNIYEASPSYKLVFQDITGCILKETGAIAFPAIADSHTLDVYLEDCNESLSNGLSVSIAYDSTKNLINTSWYSPTGTNATINVRTYRVVTEGISSICNNASYGASGSVVCNITGYVGTIRTDAVSVQNGIQKITIDTQYLRANALSDSLSIQEQAFWSFAVLLTCIGFGFVSPVLTIISALFGMVVLYFLGISVAFSVPFIGVAVVIGVIISQKVKL